MWKPIIKKQDRLKGKVVFRKTSEKAGFYIPIATRKMAHIPNTCFCKVNEWQSDTESSNKHKLLIQFMDKEQKGCRILHDGLFTLPMGVTKEYIKDRTDTTRIVIPVIIDKGNLLIDLEDLKKELTSG